MKSTALIPWNSVYTLYRIDKTTMGSCSSYETDRECYKYNSKCKWSRSGNKCVARGRVDERQAGPLNGLPVGILNLVAAYDKLDMDMELD